MQSADLATRRALLQAQAHETIADQNLDDGLRKLHSDTLSEVTQDREDPIFKALFSSDIGATVRFALARQLTVAQQLVTNLSLSIIPPALKSHIAKLEQLIAAGQAVLQQRKTAAFGRTEANLGTLAWKDDVNAVRLTAYGALLGIAAKTRRPKTWAESFFMSSSSATDAIELEVETPTPPAPLVATPPEA